MERFGLTAGALSPRRFLDWYNALGAGAVTVLSTVFGQQWYLFAAFLALNLLDWLSGWYRARRLKNESSTAGLAGAVKKLWYWALVAMAFLISGSLARLGGQLAGVDLSFLAGVGWLTLAALAVNEARSVCENLVQAGIPVPAILAKGLAVGQKLLRDRQEAALPAGGDGEGEGARPEAGTGATLDATQPPQGKSDGGGADMV